MVCFVNEWHILILQFYCCFHDLPDIKPTAAHAAFFPGNRSCPPCLIWSAECHSAHHFLTVDALSLCMDNSIMGILLLAIMMCGFFYCYNRADITVMTIIKYKKCWHLAYKIYHKIIPCVFFYIDQFWPRGHTSINGEGLTS